MGEVNLLRHVFKCEYLSSAAWHNAGGAVELPIITS